MRLSNIIHSTSLSENDDDMFPGTDSSVFDEVKDQQPFDLARLNKKRLDFYQVRMAYNSRRWDLLTYLRNNNAIIHVGPGNKPASNEILYSTFDWFDETRLHGIISGHDAIDKSSPVLKDIQKLVSKVSQLTDRETTFSHKVDAIEEIISAVEQEQRETI